MRITAILAVMLATLGAFAANPILPLWEFIPDGEPHVFEDPDNPGKLRVYLYGSHDTRQTAYCGRDQVVWSASVDDLRKWRFDGVAFRSLEDAGEAPLSKDGLGDVLFAPDVVETRGTDGRKTYWLYPNTQAGNRRSMVAKSSRPDGPFKVCNWDPANPAATVGCMGFDPAVLVDDDGRVYGYWGGAGRSFAAELDPATMATIKPGAKVVENMVSGYRQPGEFRFYEASSIRKIKGKYVFVYSRWTKPGEFGLDDSNYTLAYAYSDGPLGPWTYGGTIIDARGRETGPDGKTVVTATPNGNTHGSICEIAGKWYVFYHRQVGVGSYARQAMVAPISVEVEEGQGGKVRISEAEYTSEGFETGGLDPFERHAAGIACHYTGPKPAVNLKFGKRFTGTRIIDFSGPYAEPFHADGYWASDPYDSDINRSSIVHCTDGSVVGYKYFDFSKTCGHEGLKLEISLVPHGVDAKVEVWTVRPCASEGGVKIGEFALSASMPEASRTLTVDVSPLAARSGKEALYFVFTSALKEQSVCEMESFRFVGSQARSYSAVKISKEKGKS